MINEVFENVIEIIDFIDINFIKNIVKVLLNSIDVCGCVLWVYMIDIFNIDENLFVWFYSLYVDLGIFDNLGNIVVYRLVGVFIIYNDILEFLLFVNVDVNVKNVYDELVVFVFFFEYVFDSLFRYGIELNIQDCWGRILLMFLLKYRLIFEFIRKVIIKGKVDVNVCDVNGIILLYFVVYYNFEE